MTTLEDIDALIGEAQETRNELNGLDKIPETVDEVIDILFGDEEGIVGLRSFAEGAACECKYIDFEFFRNGKWVRTSELECEVPRTDIGELAKYNAAYRGALDGSRTEPSQPEPSSNYYNNPVQYVNARHENSRDSLRSRVERTAQLDDAQRRYAISRSAMDQASATFRRMGLNARQAAVILSSHSFQNTQREFLEGALDVDEFQRNMEAILVRRLGPSASPRFNFIETGEPIRETEPDIEIRDFGGGRWTIHRHTAGEESPWLDGETLQANHGRIWP